LIEEFFTGPVWAAITGFVTLLSAVVPLTLFLARRIENLRIAESVVYPVPPPLGCRGTFTALAINFCLVISYLALSAGFFLVIFAISEDLFAIGFIPAWDLYPDFRSFLTSTLAQCGIICLQVTLGLVLLGYSSILALRRGYEFGIYATLIGINILTSPSWIAGFFIQSKYSWYLALYWIVCNVVTGFLASVVILFASWMVLKSYYSEPSAPGGVRLISGR